MFFNQWYQNRNLTIEETPAKKVFTGILDPRGQPIYKVFPKEPIGFLHFPEKESEYE